MPNHQRSWQRSDTDPEFGGGAVPVATIIPNNGGVCATASGDVRVFDKAGEPHILDCPDPFLDGDYYVTHSIWAGWRTKC